MKAKLAFYKGTGDWIDWCIRKYTRSPYSHVELVVGNNWYSISPRDLRVRCKQITLNKEHWDFVDVEIDEKHLKKFFVKTYNAKYDWLGIFFSVGLFNRGEISLHNKRKYFCSEWCASALKLDRPDKYDPGDLYKQFKK